MPVLETLLFTVLTLILPVHGLLEMRRLRRDLAAGDTGARLRVYRETFWMEWLAAMAFGAWWVARGDSLAAAGLSLGYREVQWIGVALGIVATGFLVGQWQFLMRRPRRLSELIAGEGNARDLVPMIPRSRREGRWFDALSITAGVCEEFLYRGLLLTAATATLGTWGGVILSSVVFGLGHAYQGPGGVLRTGVVGVGLALLTVLSGSIFAAVLVHLTADLTSGRLLQQAVRAETGAGVVGSEA